MIQAYHELFDGYTSYGEIELAESPFGEENHFTEHTIV